MGYPAAEEFGANTAYEPFERGRMLWRNDNNRTYAFFDGGKYSDYSFPPWEPIPFSCTDAQQLGNPRMGFGRVWCENPDVRQRIGNAIESEIGSNRPLQDFERGFMIYVKELDTVISVYNDGQWAYAR